MTDQNALAAKVREARDLHRDAAKMVTITDAEREIHQHVADAMEALLPRPTMADMNAEERDTCRRMQADVKGRDRRPVIVNHYWDDETARVMWPHGFIEEIECERVTPRPDLPRMEWPGTEKPAPALPDGWRLADHQFYGRVLVTIPEPDDDGYVWFVRPDPRDDAEGYDDGYCKPDELTYLDQEGGTSDAVPPNTLAVGSVWNDADALARACDASGRDQIIALDRVGDAYVWSEAAEWWAGSGPLAVGAPFTIIHDGKKAHQ